MPEGPLHRSGLPASSRTDDAMEKAQKALAQRPGRSARFAIAGAFAISFLLIFTLAIAGMFLLSGLRERIRFLESAGEFESALLETRRYEKNYLFVDVAKPAGAAEDLDEALEHLRRARTVAESSASRIRDPEGAARWRSALDDLAAYQTILTALPGRGAIGEGTKQQIREAGRRILHDAAVVLEGERNSLDRLLDRAFVAAMLFLVASLAVVAILAAAVTTRVIRPINRFVAYTRRIAEGDFSPIAPVRRYRDEFSGLAVALNAMLRELATRQESLVRAGRLASLGTLTSGIAHELNNPLNNISLTTEALIEDLEHQPPEKTRELLEDIFPQVERASGTVRNLLDFTRSEHPVFALTRVPDVLTTVTRLVRNEAQLSQVEIGIEASDQLPPIRACERSLEQILLNLCLNAIQAMPGGGMLTLRAEPVNSALVRVDIEDTGSGIDPENLEKIFDPFFTTKEVGAGTGLGLTVTHRLVEDHGGRIEVASEPGKGTTFSLFLRVNGPVEPPP